MPKLSFRLLSGELVLTRRRNVPDPQDEEEEGVETESDDADADVVNNGDGDGWDGEADVDGDADGNGDGGEEVEVVSLPLPQADFFLSVVYPPALYIKENKPETVERIINGPKHASLHGVWETKGLPIPMRNESDDESDEELDDIELSPALQARIDRLVPQVSHMTSKNHLIKEFNKHSRNIPFFTTAPDYIEFALDVYERYEFVNLIRFVADRVEEEGIGQVVQFYQMPWVSVRLEDLLRIVHSYRPIRRFRDGIGLQLLKRGGRHVFFEVSMNFTQDKRPAHRCRKTPEVYVNGRRKDADKVSRDLGVLILEASRVDEDDRDDGEVEAD